MQKLITFAVLGWLAQGAGHALAADRDDALALLERAIKAQGGAEALAKTALLSRKGSGTLTLFDMDLAFTDELLVQRPDRLRFTLEVVGADKQKSRVLLVINKNKGWQENGGVVSELSDQRLTELKEEARVQWVCMLTPLVQKDSAYELAVAKEMKINDKPALGIKASLKGHPDIVLYFDKDSALLVKIERQAKEAGVEVAKEYLLSDYKEVDGVKLPMHIVEKLNGKKFTDLKVDSYRLLNKVDEAQFGKP
jgi:hypothetical protein